MPSLTVDDAALRPGATVPMADPNGRPREALGFWAALRLEAILEA